MATLFRDWSLKPIEGVDNRKRVSRLSARLYIIVLPAESTFPSSSRTFFLCSFPFLSLSFLLFFFFLPFSFLSVFLFSTYSPCFSRIYFSVLLQKNITLYFLCQSTRFRRAMTSPRKFAEKIALLQQKQAQDDAAFTTILNEVEAAKQVKLLVFVWTTKFSFNALFRRRNGVTQADPLPMYRVESTNETFSRKATERRLSCVVFFFLVLRFDRAVFFFFTQVEHPNGSDRLLQLPENPSTWRRSVRKERRNVRSIVSSSF